MRLHRLTLRDVKGVRERTVHFPDHGVLVIEGPNEVGKSTLLEAFDRLLDPRAKATSQSSRVRELQPVGRDVGPFVEAEFSVGGHRLRFAKQWLRSPSTTLEILSPVREQRSGSAAQDRVDEILAESLDRPLWEALRFTQAGELRQVALTDSGVLTQALDGASGADLHSADGAQLLDRVEREFLRYHTPTGRPGGDLKAAMTAANSALADAVLAHARVQETEQLLARHTRLEHSHAELSSVRPALQTGADLALEHAEAVRQVVEAHRDAMGRLEQAKERSVRASEDLAARVRAIEDLSLATEQLARSEETVLSQERALAAIEGALAELAEADAGAQRLLDSAREVAERAQADTAHLADVVELAALTRRAEQLTAVLTELQRAQQDLESAVVTPGLMRAVEAAHQDLRVLQAKAEAAGAVLTLTGLGADQPVLVGGVPRTLTESDGEVDIRVHEDLSIELPGLLRIAVRPAAEDRSRAELLAAAQAGLADLLRQAGTEDLAGARAAAERRAALQAAVAALSTRAQDLTTGEDQAALVGRLETLQDEVQIQRAARPGDCSLPLGVAQARAVSRAAITAYEQARVAAAESARGLRETERQAATGRLALEKLRGALGGLRDRLAADRGALERARARVGDEDLQAAVAGHSGMYARVEAVAAEARREMQAADVTGVRDRLEAAQDRLSEHDRQVSAVRDDLLSVTGQVEMASGEGRQEAYDQAIAAFLDARGALEAVDRRARAARQLHSTLGRHRDTAHRAYVRPYAQEIERLGQMVYGETFAVQVEDDLTIAARHLDGTLVPFDQLSGGAKEQLGILARLAVSSLVDRDHGVPVIIDDALGYTDPERLHKVGAVFGGPAERAQVILLTCTPDRYVDIGAATTIRLTA